MPEQQVCYVNILGDAEEEPELWDSDMDSDSDDDDDDGDDDDDAGDDG